MHICVYLGSSVVGIGLLSCPFAVPYSRPFAVPIRGLAGLRLLLELSQEAIKARGGSIQRGFRVDPVPDILIGRSEDVF
jgi:hypothetical protein